MTPRPSLRSRPTPLTAPEGDRNAAAIAGTETLAPERPATPARASKKTAAAPAVEAGQVWLSVYLRPEVLEPAKSAYLADWMNHGEHDTFPKWVSAAIHRHARLTTKQRAEISSSRPEKIAGQGKARQYLVDQRVTEALHAAVKSDQAAGRFPSDSEWVGDALHAATVAARQHNGGTLPDPPKRLPNKMPDRT